MASRARNLADLIRANSTISIPTGSSGQRPSGDSGMFRLNTTNNYFEGYTSSGWSQFDGTKTFINSNEAPTNPGVGDLWLNTTNTVLSVYTTSGWIKTAAGSATNRFVDVFVANAAQNTFTTSYNYTYVDVYKNNIRVPTTDYIANNSISVTLNTSANANDIIEVYSFTNVGGSAIGTGGLSISSITIVNSAGAQLSNVTGFSEAGGGYVEVIGSNFISGITASISGTNALSTLFISSTQLRVQVPPKSAGTYSLTLTNATGSSVTLTNSITYLSTPYWITASRLNTIQMSISNQFQLQAALANSFSLGFGSSLPSGLSLNQNNGLITGTLDNFSSNSYTSTFTVNALSANGISIPRTFNMFINAVKYETEAIANTNTFYKYWIFENPSQHAWSPHPTGNNIVQIANNFSHIIKHRFDPPDFGVYDVLVVGGGGASGDYGVVGSTGTHLPGGGGGVAEKFNFILNSSTSVYRNKVSHIHVTNGGIGYLTAPNVTITASSNDSPSIIATANSTIFGGNVISITVTNNGLGYTQPPTITLSGGGGSGATAEAIVGGHFCQIEVGPGGNKNHPHAFTSNVATNRCGSNTTFIRNLVNNLIPSGNLFYQAIGGGGGANMGAGGTDNRGKNGGSGGGSYNTSRAAGFGVQSTSPTGGYGNDGGLVFIEQPGSILYNAGGGGAGAVGASSARGQSLGGIGIQLLNWTIRGTDANNVFSGVKGYYGGGGSSFGQSWGPNGNPATAGSAGGGGALNASFIGDGIPGTGGGGSYAANGGSGICIVRQRFGYEGDILLAAGGGNGGTFTIDSSNAGGGGAGGLICTSNNQFNILPGTTYTVTIGGPGANSTFNQASDYTIIALAGGSGGSSNATSNTNGSIGGSGGGKGGGTSSSNTPGNTIQVLYTGYGHGNDGFAGGGGGAGGIGDGSGSGGAGITWINGQTYCMGGNEGKNTHSPHPANSGSGGHGGANGTSGICIIAYAGSQRGTGGTITTSNGYTYHTFTANGSFVG
jgi:hypothetical protein